MTYNIPNYPDNPSGQNGQVYFEYVVTEFTSIPSSHKINGYTHNPNISDRIAIGLSKQYRISKWNSNIFLVVSLDMATTGVENTVQSITNYLANNPITFYYKV